MSRTKAVAVLMQLAVLFAGGAEATAQTPARSHPGPYVFDVRGVTAPISDDPALFPALPPGTAVPARGFGLDAGGHVYLFRLGPATLGFGAAVVFFRGTAHSVIAETTDSATSATITTTSTSTTTAATAAGPVDVSTTGRLISPQVSFNFGSANGWSYLSAGYGIARIRTTGSGAGMPSGDATRNSGSLRDINVAGGARWFISSHLGVGFDLRLHLLGAGQAQEGTVGTSANAMFSAAVGLSLR